MAITKKTTAAVKKSTAKKATAKKTTFKSTKPAGKYTPNEEEIRRRAYEIHLQKNGDSNPMEDWLQAEQELSGKRKRS